ncbi:Bug family tripartite tricarboxylate transporter substrate binding protein [Roseomonas sp. CCTCC AB2023176]|uniref:Bug family tripartite tricarboxylate transporter substrate binding protein n=1 Tax=Roseomonas sp. CCTCC AB2023176 TaxID=3342640 RepID=UPI0035DEB670
MQRRGLIGAAGALLPLSAQTASAQTARPWAPTRPVRIIVGVAPGVGTIDLTARSVTEAMSEALGQPVVVENRPGAGGIIAVEAVSRAEKDGHTLLLGGADQIVHSFLLAERPPMDPIRDFTPIARATRDHWMVVAAPNLGVSSIAELAALGKRRPGELTYASFGPGTLFHLLGARLAQRLGFEGLHVPYRGDYTPDLLAGRIAYLAQPTALLMPHVQAGRLKALAVLSPQRLPSLPEVPTVIEAGLPDLSFNMGIILFTPGGTPPEMTGALNAAFGRAAANPAARARLADLNLELVGGTMAEAADYTRWMVGFIDDMREKVLGTAR